MNETRKSLDFGDLENIFSSKNISLTAEEQIKEIDNNAGFISRESPSDGQINIKTSKQVIKDFRNLAKKERYNHGDFLKILINHYKSVANKGS